MHPVTIAGTLSPWTPAVFSLVIYGLMILILVAVLFFMASWLGEKKTNPDKLRPYESGIIPTGTARLHYPIPFFLVAVFFLIFDVEGAFIFSWGISWNGLGWSGWLEISFFIMTLLIGLVYIWRKGGLDWGPTRTKE
ncbi:MAG: NADH-quinone oxidoreductase subunit A [Desulfobacterales bacterium]